MKVVSRSSNVKLVDMARGLSDGVGTRRRGLGRLGTRERTTLTERGTGRGRRTQGSSAEHGVLVKSYVLGVARRSRRTETGLVTRVSHCLASRESHGLFGLGSLAT